MKQNFLSTTEVAKLLNISRIAVFKKIKSGEIKAKKVGRNFVIAREDLHEAIGTILGKAGKELIEKSVKKTMTEYGEALKLLGKE